MYVEIIVTTNTFSPDSACCLTWLTQKSNYGQGLHHYTVMGMWTQKTRISPTIGSINRTRIQQTELSLSSCLWQKIHCWTKSNLLFIWYGSQLLLALSKIKVHLEGKKDFRILKTFRKMWQQCWRLFWKEVQEILNWCTIQCVHTQLEISEGPSQYTKCLQITTNLFLFVHQEHSLSIK